jgi:hypothetical protein
MLAGMSLPVEFENELENWLRERFKRQERAILEGVIKMVAAMMSEQIQRDGEARGQDLEQLSAKIQAAFDRIEGMLEKQADCIDRAARGEPLDRMN